MVVFKIYGYYHEYARTMMAEDRGFEGARDDATSAFLCSPDDHKLTRDNTLSELIESGLDFHLSSDCTSISFESIMYCYSRLLLVLPDENDAIYARMRWGFALAGPIEDDADFTWVS